MSDYRVYFSTGVDVTVDGEALVEEFPDVWQEVQDEGDDMDVFIERIVDYEGIDFLINSDYCLEHHEYAAGIEVNPA